MIRIRRNRRELMIDKLVLRMADVGIGISKTISISNTMKMTANRKKRRENGIRAEDFGSKPHSNGADFSRSIFFLVDNRNILNIIINGSIVAIKENMREVYISLEQCLIASQRLKA